MLLDSLCIGWVYFIMEWRKIKDFPNYSISDTGLVRNDIRKRNLKQCISTTGYFYVKLCDNGIKKTKKIHRLVLEAFIPNIENKKIINHKDGNKLNNCLSNLEWSNHSENILHAYNNGLNTNRKFSKEDILNIRNLKQNGITLRKIAEIFNVDFSTISLIISRKTYKTF